MITFDSYKINENLRFQQKIRQYINNEKIYNFARNSNLSSEFCYKAREDYLQSQRSVYTKLVNNPNSAKNWYSLLIAKPDETYKIRNIKNLVLPNDFVRADEVENVKLLQKIGEIFNKNYPYSGNIRERIIETGRISLDNVTKSPKGFWKKAIRKFKLFAF